MTRGIGCRQHKKTMYGRLYNYAIFFAVILHKRRRAGRRVARPRHLSSDVRLEAILRLFPNDVCFIFVFSDL